jgi:hypothetical protein
LCSSFVASASEARLDDAALELAGEARSIQAGNERPARSRKAESEVHGFLSLPSLTQHWTGTESRRKIRNLVPSKDWTLAAQPSQGVIVAREATGELRELQDGFAALITIGGRTRRAFRLASKTREARVRCAALASIAVRLRVAGHTAEIEPLLTMGARARALGCGGKRPRSFAGEILIFIEASFASTKTKRTILGRGPWTPA